MCASGGGIGRGRKIKGGGGTKERSCEKGRRITFGEGKRQKGEKKPTCGTKGEKTKILSERPGEWGDVAVSDEKFSGVPSPVSTIKNRKGEKRIGV